MFALLYFIGIVTCSIIICIVFEFVPIINEEMQHEFGFVFAGIMSIFWPLIMPIMLSILISYFVVKKIKSYVNKRTQKQ
jgi:hypothetical protein